jgi:enamine deaminase RidA (YjgF/YER057c/UK114 family)
MAGTFADQATLASDNAFIAKVQVAMIARAVEQYYNATAQPFSVLQQAKRILETAGSDAANIAHLVVAADAGIKAAAPVVPSDSATQAAVNVVLTALLK